MITPWRISTLIAVVIASIAALGWLNLESYRAGRRAQRIEDMRQVRDIRGQIQVVDERMSRYHEDLLDAKLDAIHSCWPKK